MMSQNQSQGRSGWETTVQNVLLQIEYECFDGDKKPMALVCAKIISEVYRLSSGAAIKIGGETLTADTVKSEYACLTHEDIETVIDNFMQITYPIRSVRAYLRAALYNAAVEGEAKMYNDLRASGLIGG